jgi:hypothetical protein
MPQRPTDIYATYATDAIGRGAAHLPAEMLHCFYAIFDMDALVGGGEGGVTHATA